MALRTRMVVAFVAIAGTLVAAGLVLLALQRAFLMHQVDTRLERQVANAAALATGGTADQQVPGRGSGTGPGGPVRRPARREWVGDRGDAWQRPGPDPRPR